MKASTVWSRVTPYWGLRDYGDPDQLGLEATLHEYIAKLCDIFDEVKRALRPHDSCWVIMGDAYGGLMSGEIADNLRTSGRKKNTGTIIGQPRPSATIMHKCLLQIPARFAIAMTDRGWVLRNEIICHKPNCMPSSVKDRFTIDYEKIFFFSKNPTYWFEQQIEALRRPEATSRNATHKHEGYGNPVYSGFSYNAAQYTGRNKRCVWSIPTQAFPEAHYAVYPTELCETPIKAGCPELVYKQCGKPQSAADTQPACHCNAEYEPGIVLDPFFGARTTAVVAHQLNRSWIGIELSHEYIDIAKKRLTERGVELTTSTTVLDLCS